MKNLFLGLFSVLSFNLIAQYQLNGIVFDENSNEPLVGATVIIDESFNGGFTDADGNFRLNKILTQKIILMTSYIGYNTDSLEINVKENEDVVIYLKPLSYQTDEVLVSGTRVQANTPATVTTLNKKDIEKNNLGQDLPYLLQQTPSVVTTSDGGTGIGYTGLRIRGSDASRINVTINGIPLNDAESHGVFWVNMPDFASSIKSLQIQRGVGTSTNGAGAFGATVNLETKTLNPNAYGEINNSIGFLENNQEVDNVQYNSRKHTVQFGSGLMNNRFAFEGRLSNIQSEGYVDRATADLKSYFLSGGYYGEKTVVKAITFGGKEVTYQSWNGTPQSRIENDAKGLQDHIDNNGLNEEQAANLINSGRTYNFYTYENQVDNYNQDHYQLHLSHEFNSKLTANTSFHYTKGLGYFEEFKNDESFSDYGLPAVIRNTDTITSTDLIRRRWLDNDFYGLVFSVLYKPSSKVNMTLGGGVNTYRGDHFGEIIWAEFASLSFPGKNYYFSESEKNDGNVYLKTSYQLNKKLLIYGDLQVRRITYTTEGTDNDLREFDIDEEFTFFNPKVGANYSINENVSTYLFAGIANREPNRSDFTDQPLNTPKKDANKAERLYNLELGSEFNYSNYAITANLFGMYYTDQLVSTGQLNDVGSPLRQNVDESYRVGIELQTGTKLTENLSWNLNFTYSQNKIVGFTEPLYDYTNGFDIITIERNETDIALSPEIITGSELVYKFNNKVDVALLTRYVGDQYLDNSSSEASKIDAYLVNDVRFQAIIPQKLFKEVKFQLLINNILNEEYSSNGYTFSYVAGEKITENFYYPQSFRNYLIGLSLKF